MSTTPASRRRPLQILVGGILVAIALIGVLVFGRGSGGGSTQTTPLAGAAAAVQTKATLKGLRVLSVGTPGTPTGGNLVVEVSLQQAELLEFLVKNTDFTYVLKSPVDADSPDPSTTGVDLNTFKAAFG